MAECNADQFLALCRERRCDLDLAAVPLFRMEAVGIVGADEMRLPLHFQKEPNQVSVLGVRQSSKKARSSSARL